MVRALIASCCCILLALLSVTGAHGHRATGPIDRQTDTATHGHPSTSESSSVLTLLASDAHAHGHEEHSQVDVDPLVKVLGKIASSFSVDFVFLAWVGAFVSILSLLAHIWVGLAPPDRPPKKRWHPFQLPPAQAPPRTA